MQKFHICYPDHQCSNNQDQSNLFEIGTRIVFAANQFKQSMTENITVRIATAVV